jgi:hypothetical protein
MMRDKRARGKTGLSSFKNVFGVGIARSWREEGRHRKIGMVPTPIGGGVRERSPWARTRVIPCTAWTARRRDNRDRARFDRLPSRGA